MTQTSTQTQIITATLSLMHDTDELANLSLEELIVLLEEENSQDLYCVTAFHGTGAIFDTFDDDFKGTYNGCTATNTQGHFFTANISNAASYGSNVHEALLEFSNPYVIDAKYESYSTFGVELDHIIESIDTEEYDALIIHNYRDGDGEAETQYCVFNTSSISIMNTYKTNF